MNGLSRFRGGWCTLPLLELLGIVRNTKKKKINEMLFSLGTLVSVTSWWFGAIMFGPGSWQACGAMYYAMYGPKKGHGRRGLWEE